MTFHGHGYLRLALPSNAVPLTGNVYSGFGFRSSQDSTLLFHRESPVRPPHHLWGSRAGLVAQRRESGPPAWPADPATVPRPGHARCPCSRAT